MKRSAASSASADVRRRADRRRRSSSGLLLTAGFGPNFIPRHRFYALDKNTGETVWLSTPGQAPYDTTYSTPIVSVINGQRLLIAGNGDGGVYALKMETGEKVWGFPLSKRGLTKWSSKPTAWSSRRTVRKTSTPPPPWAA
ncbi:MAG: PQQ-binding-like beta-propeller repeat protein [Bryobacterales bacterium]